MDHPEALGPASGRMSVDVGGVVMPVDFESIATNPLWLGGSREEADLFHWRCQLGGDAPIEFHHTQSWPEFDPVIAVGCLMADAQDVTEAGSLPEWSRHCGYDPENDVSDIFSRLAVAYEAIMAFAPRVVAMFHQAEASPAVDGPSFAAA